MPRLRARHGRRVSRPEADRDPDRASRPGFGSTPRPSRADLARRQHGYGRGGRMKIEKDEALFTGRPARRRDARGPGRLRDREPRPRRLGEASWGRSRSTPRRRESVASRRRAPGHADLAGGLKYGRRDLRDILERASARESAARVAAGALCRQLLLAFGIRVKSGVLSIGDVRCRGPTRLFLRRPREGRRDVAASVPWTGAPRRR